MINHQEDMFFSFVRVILLALLLASTKALDRLAPALVYPATVACEEYSSSTNATSWSFLDCQNVWSSWSRSVEVRQGHVFMDRSVLERAREIFRQQGLKCFVELPPVSDGVGSSSIRSFITWLFAEEIGCRWVLPDWGVRESDDGGQIRYCHPVVAEEKRVVMSRQALRDHKGEECMLVNWLEYFGFDKHSVPLPEHGIAKTVVLDPGALPFNESLEALRSELNLIDGNAQQHLVWDFLVFKFANPNSSSRMFQSFKNWDAHKRRITQETVGKLRKTFYEREEQRTFDGVKECWFDQTRLNFVIHVRLGDRKVLFPEEDHYFSLLGKFMDSLTSRVVDLNLPPPVFHVFSETASPCPPQDTGVFEEFSEWPPVEEWQIEPCWKAKAPTDCPEKEAGLVKSCPPARSGIFYLEGKRLLLHLGADVRRTMSCMIHADGILMGCSTFGHIAGILTNGISFFSMQCHGKRTRDQYRLVPPIALSEGGKLWVPVSGSWRNPALWSNGALTEALEDYVAIKANSSSLS